MPSSEREGGAQDRPEAAGLYTLSDLQKLLSISRPQAYALVRSGELRASRAGGRRAWVVERRELERWIAQRYAETAAEIARRT